jgi:hypothetical protein
MNVTASISQSNPLETKRAALLIRRESLIDSFGRAARQVDGGEAQRFFSEITATNEFIVTLDEIAQTMQPRPRSDVPRFVVSSLFLHECFKKLTADRSEQFSFITGIEIAGAFVLNQILELEHDSRTPAGVQANAAFTHRLLVTLERFGHRLLAHVHSHPGNGPSSTTPSGIDENFQSRLERAGHLAVAAIFSRDGYVRFFRMDRKFEVEVFGEGVKKHAPNVFQITQAP